MKYYQTFQRFLLGLTFVLLLTSSLSNYAIASPSQSNLSTNATLPTDIVVSPGFTEITIQKGEQWAVLVDVTNNGDTPITVTEITDNVEWLELLPRPFPFVIGVGETINFPVVVNPPSDLDVDNQYTGKVQIVTDVTTKDADFVLNFESWAAELSLSETIVVDYPYINTTMKRSFSVFTNGTNSPLNITVEGSYLELSNNPNSVSLSSPVTVNYGITANELDEKYYLNFIHIESDEGTRSIPVIIKPQVSVNGFGSPSFTQSVSKLPFNTTVDKPVSDETHSYIFAIPANIKRFNVMIDNPSLNSDFNVSLTGPDGTSALDLTDLNEAYSYTVNNPQTGVWVLDLDIFGATSGSYSLNLATDDAEVHEGWSVGDYNAIRYGLSRMHYIPVPAGLTHLAIDFEGDEDGLEGLELFSPSGVAKTFADNDNNFSFDETSPEKGVWSLNVMGDADAFDPFAPLDKFHYRLSAYGHQNEYIPELPTRVIGSVQSGDTINYQIPVDEEIEELFVDFTVTGSEENLLLFSPSGVEATLNDDVIAGSQYYVEFPSPGIWTIQILGEEDSTDTSTFDFVVYAEATQLANFTASVTNPDLSVLRGQVIEESVLIQNDLSETLTIEYLSSDNQWLDFGVPENDTLSNGGVSYVPYLLTPNSEDVGQYEGHLIIQTNFGKLFARISLFVEDTAIELEMKSMNLITQSTSYAVQWKIENIGVGTFAYYGGGGTSSGVGSVNIGDINLQPGESSYLSMTFDFNGEVDHLNQSAVYFRSNIGLFVIDVSIIFGSIAHTSQEQFNVVAPAISEVQRNLVFPLQGQELTVSATVTDGDLFNAWVVFDDGTVWEEFVLSGATSIGQFLKGEEVRYKIVALDKFGNIGQSATELVVINEFEFKGLAVDQDDNPLEGAFITVENTGGDFISHTFTKADGTFSVFIPEFDDGDSISLSASFFGDTDSSSSSIDVTLGERTINFDLTVPNFGEEPDDPDTTDPTDTTTSDEDDSPVSPLYLLAIIAIPILRRRYRKTA